MTLTMQPDTTWLPDIRKKMGELVEDLGQEAAVELMQSFFDDSDTVSENLKKFLLTEDWSELRREAHSLKSVAAVYGLTTVSRLAESVEHACANAQSDGLPGQFTDQVNELTSGYEIGLATLRWYLDTEYGEQV